MSKMNCNIIKDLLPSYLDDICSPESRQLVEEHLAECESCKKIYERTKLEMIHTDTSSAKEVDYFKKIKKNVLHKNAVINAIISLLFTLQLYCNFYYYHFSSNIPKIVNYLFPILIAGLLFVILPDYAEHKVPAKIKYTVLGIEFLAMTYIFGILLYTGQSIMNDVIPFGMETDELGSFLSAQILALTIGFIIAFAVTLFLSIRKKAICPALHFVPLGGISLMFEYKRFLHEFSSKFVVSSIITPYVVFAGEVIILVGIYMFVNRKKRL